MAEQHKTYDTATEAMSGPAKILYQNLFGEREQVTAEHRERNEHNDYQLGTDTTVTINRGQRHFNRTASDTPNPRSNPPSSGDSQSSQEEEQERSRNRKIAKGMPNQRAHTAAFQFTGMPGRTVHAPIVANQVVDTYHERRVASTINAVLVRSDTYHYSFLMSLVPLPSGKWEVCHTIYARRAPNIQAEADSPPATSLPVRPTMRTRKTTQVTNQKSSTAVSRPVADESNLDRIERKRNANQG